MKESKPEEQGHCHAEVVENSSSVENSNRDKIKPLEDMSEPILQTVGDQLNYLIQEMGELLNMPGQKGEGLRFPQDDTALVTQRVYDPVTNDQVDEMSKRKIKSIQYARRAKNPTLSKYFNRYPHHTQQG